MHFTSGCPKMEIPAVFAPPKGSFLLKPSLFCKCCFVALQITTFFVVRAPFSHFFPSLTGIKVGGLSSSRSQKGRIVKEISETRKTSLFLKGFRYVWPSGFVYKTGKSAGFFRPSGKRAAEPLKKLKSFALTKLLFTVSDTC